jgi:Protein of unknown function (DUF3467)
MALHVPESVSGGVYAELAMVWHNQHGFTIDFFAQASPQPITNSEGQLAAPFIGVARVHVPPDAMFALAQAIADNVTLREENLAKHAEALGDQPLYPPTTWENGQDDDTDSDG